MRVTRGGMTEAASSHTSAKSGVKDALTTGVSAIAVCRMSPWRRPPAPFVRTGEGLLVAQRVQCPVKAIARVECSHRQAARPTVPRDRSAGRYLHDHEGRTGAPMLRALVRRLGPEPNSCGRTRRRPWSLGRKPPN